MSGTKPSLQPPELSETQMQYGSNSLEECQVEDCAVSALVADAESAGMSSDAMSISIAMLAGTEERESTTMEVTAQTTIDELKNLIHAKFGARPSLQSLVLGDVQLQDGSTSLEECGVEDGATLTLVKSFWDLYLSFTMEKQIKSGGWSYYHQYTVTVAPATDFCDMLNILEQGSRKEKSGRPNSKDLSAEFVEQQPASWLLRLLSEGDWQETLATKPDDANKLFELVSCADFGPKRHEIKSSIHFWDGRQGKVVMEMGIHGHIIVLRDSYTGARD